MCYCENGCYGRGRKIQKFLNEIMGRKCGVTSWDSCQEKLFCLTELAHFIPRRSHHRLYIAATRFAARCSPDLEFKQIFPIYSQAIPKLCPAEYVREITPCIPITSASLDQCYPSAVRCIYVSGVIDELLSCRFEVVNGLFQSSSYGRQM
jgi:hypothetical protein